MKTSELTGDALDWAVAKCGFIKGTAASLIKSEVRPYSTDWAQGGPIIEREGLQLWKGGKWCAAYGNSVNTPDFLSGQTPLIAAMRCFVASKLGDEVEIPEELKGESK